VGFFWEDSDLTGSRDFLMFMPQGASLKTIYSYYLSTVNVNPEGDATLSDEINLLGLGKNDFSFFLLRLSPVLPLSAPGSALWRILRLDSNISLIGYFLAGGIAGAISRTATAPFDRVKVYLIAQTGNVATKQAVKALKQGEALQVAKKVGGPIKDAIKALWRTGGVKSFFAGWDPHRQLDSTHG
jgi:solute carrier family 25 (mitochondrial phosphate transporter), member 23/24/25/41